MKVFDVGMYDGQDTAYYLSCGHEVIAIEANPDFCSKGERKFRAEIESRRLTIVNVAIADGELVDLTLCGQELGSSTIHAGLIARRDPKGSIRVKARRLPDVIREHGQPDFVKIDIEGADRDCVLSLTRDIAPTYLSFEAPSEIADIIEHLSGIGFSGFKAVHQTSFRTLPRQELLSDRLSLRLIDALGYANPTHVRRNGTLFAREHSSGPAPWESDGRYISATRLISQWNRARQRNGLGGWYDIHAVR